MRTNTDLAITNFIVGVVRMFLVYIHITLIRLLSDSVTSDIAFFDSLVWKGVAVALTTILVLATAVALWTGIGALVNGAIKAQEVIKATTDTTRSTS